MCTTKGVTITSDGAGPWFRHNCGRRLLQRPGGTVGEPSDIYSESDFDGLSWHDCRLWGFQLLTGDPSEDDWRAELALDIDFITAWKCGADKHITFEIAPASLVFRNVKALKIQLDWTERTIRWGQDVSIDALERTRVQDEGDKPYYSWRFRLHEPPGEIVFRAAGFTQTLLAAPVESTSCTLSLRQRSLMILRAERESPR